ncbi:MAG: PAS domain-containing protein [Planctomycetaceae bacterium]|nr:PAS domain-containing protein [Planctomycetaceae bacterium]
MGPYLLLYAALIGHFAFAATYHAVLWAVARRNVLLAVFSVDCAIRAGLSWTILSIMTATTTQQASDAASTRIALVLLIMIATTWSVRLISGVRANAFVWFLTIAFAALFIIQAFVVRLNAPVAALRRTELPWGEIVATPIAGVPGWWVGPMLLLGFLTQVFALYCGLRLWRRDRVSGGLISAAACVTVLILTLESLRTFQIFIAPMLGAFPNVLWVGAIAVLIARGHRRTQEQLAASEQRFRGIFEQTFQFIGLLQTDGVLIEANRTALDFAGARAADVMNKPFWEAPWWKHSSDLQQRLREAIRTAAAGSMVRFEVTHPRPDGELAYVDFSLKPIRDADGRVVLLIPEGRDITERKLAEEALKTGEARTRAILQALPDLMFRLDVEGRILDYFASQRDDLYAAPEEFLGRRMPDVLPEPVGIVFQTNLRETFDTRRPQVFEYSLELPRLGITHFEARMVLCNDEELVTIVRNVTSRKQAEERRRELETQLVQAQKMEAIGQLAGGVAHDFNNLLTVINGYGELLLQEIPAADSRHALVADICEAGARAASLTRRLLTFGRRQMSELRAVDFNVVVAEAERMLRRLIGEQLDLRTAIHGEPVLVMADPGQLDQVIMNLAVNARDAMPEGGTLTIRTELIRFEEPPTATHDAKPGPYAVLTVSDTGRGMSPDVRRRAFEPFFTTKGLGQGTGLGLATVRSVADECGGFLTVDSELGAGTTFKLFLPAIHAPTVVMDRKTDAPPAAGGPETILLVEDDDAVRLLTLRMLRQFGYVVLEASGGTKAIQLAESHPGPIDLMVTDVVMPEMGGRELAEHLHAIRPGLSVLYLSGYTDDQMVRHGVSQAETAFLQKPFTVEALAAKVRQVLDAAAPHTAL